MRFKYICAALIQQKRKTGHLCLSFHQTSNQLSSEHKGRPGVKGQERTHHHTQALFIHNSNTRLKNRTDPLQTSAKLIDHLVKTDEWSFSACVCVWVQCLQRAADCSHGSSGDVCCWLPGVQLQTVLKCTSGPKILGKTYYWGVATNSDTSQENGMHG